MCLFLFLNKNFRNLFYNRLGDIMYKVLIVEDDIDINNLLKEFLIRANYQVVQAFTGADGLLHLKEKVDIVLLDLMMPVLNGEEMIERMRQEGYQEPIIVISAKVDEDTRYHVLDIGADDFITKPFQEKNVLYRVKANIRRYREFSSQKQRDVMQWKNLVYDRNKNTFTLADQELKVTPIEREILLTLLQNPAKIFTKENLYQAAWKEDYIYEADTVNVHISNLRNKIKKLDREEYIETLWGMGYRLKK